MSLDGARLVVSAVDGRRVRELTVVVERPPGNDGDAGAPGSDRDLEQ